MLPRGGYEDKGNVWKGGREAGGPLLRRFCAHSKLAEWKKPLALREQRGTLYKLTLGGNGTLRHAWKKKKEEEEKKLLTHSTLSLFSPYNPRMSDH